MTNLIEDVSKLTTISDKVLVKVLKKSVFCMCEAIEEDLIQEKDFTALDVGIGILYIKLDDPKNIVYKFEPSKYLQKAVNETVINKQNLLEDVLNISLSKKFLEAYKDLC